MKTAQTLAWTTAACVAVAGCAVQAQTPPTDAGFISESVEPLAPASDPLNMGDWVYIDNMSDEFSGEDFDRTVWYNLGENGNYRGKWKGRAPSQFNPDNIVGRDGFLYLTSRWQPDFDFADETQSGNPTNALRYGEIAPVTTAALLSQNSFHYGYMEIRAKKADGPVSSSFWTTGPGGETDAFESFGRNPNPGKRWSERKLHTSFHDWRKGSPTIGKRIWDNTHILDFRVADDFHVYGFEWDPDYVSIYIDGALVRCTSREELGDRWVATAPHQVWIDSEIFDWEVKPEQLSAEDFGEDGIHYIVDYARVFQRRSKKKGPGCPARNNLLDNGDFEKGVQGWNRGGEITSDAYEGQGALILRDRQTVERTVMLEPDTLYLLSARVISDDTNEKDVWRNAYLGVKDESEVKNDVHFFFPRWQLRSLQFRTGAENAETTIYVTNAPHGGQTRVDNIRLIEMKTQKVEGS